MTCEWIELTSYKKCEIIDTAEEINVLSEVVGKDLCCSCGVCAGLCPTNALSMKLQANGDLTPHVGDGRCLEKCRICLDVCPFSEGVHDPRPHNEKSFDFTSNSQAIFNEDIGWHIRSVVGYRKQNDLRAISASGGLATWILETLLKKGEVTRIVVVRLAQDRNKGFFEFHEASTIQQLRQAAGSIYHPVEISDIIRKIYSDKKQRWAVVGVPCLCTAIRNIGHLKQQIPFVFGLACGMYQNTFYTEMLLEKSGVNRHEVKHIEYRRKSDSGPSSNYRFLGTDNKKTSQEVEYKGLPYFLGKNAYFRVNACNYCKDVFAETADACFMDAWLPEYSKNPKGTSLVVIRNQCIDKIFSNYDQSNEIEIEKIGPEQVVNSQFGQIQRKQIEILMRLGTESLDYKSQPIACFKRINWLMQKKTQKRSKTAWAKWGRKYGPLAFWFAMLDILILQKLLFDMLPRTISLSRRIIKKITNYK